MTPVTTPRPRNCELMWMRYAYGAFLVLSCYFFFVSHDLESAVSNLGIALIFDPFNRELGWKDRKFWQRAWLIVHLLIVLAGFSYMIFA